MEVIANFLLWAISPVTRKPKILYRNLDDPQNDLATNVTESKGFFPAWNRYFERRLFND
jgi:hypothetical protein